MVLCNLICKVLTYLNYLGKKVLLYDFVIIDYDSQSITHPLLQFLKWKILAINLSKIKLSAIVGNWL